MTNDDFVRPSSLPETPRRSIDSALPRESEVVDFLVRLHDNLYNRNVDAMKVLYEQELNVISEKYYKTSRWPSIEDVAAFYSQFSRIQDVLMALYADIYYRHVFVLGEITLEDRTDSWEKYVKLLTFFIDETESPNGDTLDSLVIPTSWVWDILDEMVYQLQECCRWRSRLCNSLGKHESASLQQEMNKAHSIWRVPQVLELLHKLASNPKFKNFFATPREAIDSGNLGFQLGYFASISLLRLHVLMGDYYSALVAVSNIDLTLKNLYWKLPSYYVTLFYYLGFSYMMLRRYGDCIRILSQMLIFLTKQRSYLVSQSYQQGAITKTTEKMYQLLIICHVITKIRLDESIIQTIKEQYANRFYQLQSDNEDAFKDAFLKACPKFIDPASTLATHANSSRGKFDKGINGTSGSGPNSQGNHNNVGAAPEEEEDIDIAGNATNEPVKRQIDIFLREAANQRKVDEICSFAKLYHNISLDKLAALMKLDDGSVNDLDMVRSYILCVKHSSRQYTSNSSAVCQTDALPSTGGERDVDLYIDNDVLHIKSRRNQKIYADYFLQQINKCKQTLRNLQCKRDECMHEANRTG